MILLKPLFKGTLESLGGSIQSGFRVQGLGFGGVYGLLFSFGVCSYRGVLGLSALLLGLDPVQETLNPTKTETPKPKP